MVVHPVYTSMQLWLKRKVRYNLKGSRVSKKILSQRGQAAEKAKTLLIEKLK